MLPTIEQCHEFMVTINAGREAFGLEPLTTLEFDECEPNSSTNCLSARHMTTPIGVSLSDENTNAKTWNSDLDLREVEANKRLAAAIDTVLCARSPGGGGSTVLIPDSIKNVTDPFDGLWIGYGYTWKSSDDAKALRARLVEAGLVS